MQKAKRIQKHIAFETQHAPLRVKARPGGPASGSTVNNVYSTPHPKIKNLPKKKKKKKNGDGDEAPSSFKSYSDVFGTLLLLFKQCEMQMRLCLTKI